MKPVMTSAIFSTETRRLLDDLLVQQTRHRNVNQVQKEWECAKEAVTVIRRCQPEDELKNLALFRAWITELVKFTLHLGELVIQWWERERLRANKNKALYAAWLQDMQELLDDVRVNLTLIWERDKLHGGSYRKLSAQIAILSERLV